MTYSVHLDIDDDGAYALNLTPLLLEARWHIGMAAPDDATAAPAGASLRLWQAPSLQNPADVLGKALRITHTPPATSPRVLFSGRVTAWQPQPGDLAVGELRLAASDALGELERLACALPETVAAAPGALIARLLAALPLRRGALAGRWKVARSALGASTRLPPAVPAQLAAGSATLSWSPNLWAGSPTAAAALRDVAQAEQGRFYAARDGTLTFLGRADLAARETPLLTLTDAAESLVLGAAPQVSRVTIRLGSSPSPASEDVIWRCDEALECPPAATRRVRIRWQTPQGERIAALAAQPPRRGTDALFGHNPAIADRPLTQQMSLTLTDTSWHGATLEIRNPTRHTVYLLPGAVIRGQPFSLGAGPQTEVIDHARLNMVGDHPRFYDLPLLTSVPEASALARGILARAAPQERILEMTLDARRHPQALAASLFDRVRLRLSRPAHDAAYFITREEHHLSHQGHRHRITWQVTPAFESRWWLLGRRALGSAARLAF